MCGCDSSWWRFLPVFLATQGLPLFDATGCGQNKLRLLPETVFVQKQSELGWIIYGPQHVGWLAGPRAGCWQVLLLGRMYGACESMYLGGCTAICCCLHNCLACS